MPQYGFDVLKKKTTNLIEDKRKDKAQTEHTCWNPKRHIPLVSICYCGVKYMVAVRCFVWSLGLRQWSVSETDQILSFGDF